MHTKSTAVKISLVTAIMIAVADMVGIGVFTSLGYQVLSIKTGFPIILLWVVGGLVALCGALCYAELAAMFPRSGGEYNFLSQTYHPAVGFMSGWLSATVGFAAPIAVAAIAFAAYFKGVVPNVPDASFTLPVTQSYNIEISVFNLAMALGLVWIVTLLHIRGIKNSSLFQNVSTIIKIGLILALIVFGLTVSNPQDVSFLPESKPLADAVNGGLTGIGAYLDVMVWPIIGTFAISLVYVMYSYSGWNAATYIIGEIDDPKKTLPRAILVATLVVIALYVLLNAAFFYSTPIAEMAGKKEVAMVAGTHIFGDVGGKIVAGLICFGLISTVSAMVWIGSRVTMVMGEDMPIIGIFARKNAGGVPSAALLLQAVIVTGLVATQSFDSIINYIQFSLTLSSFVTVLGVMVLRFTRPDIERPYKTWLYPITPLIFLGFTAYMMFFQLKSSTNEALAGLATVLSGLVLYGIQAFLSNKKSLQLARETQ